MDPTANVKVARDYFISKQNTVLLPTKDFGKRKFIHVGSSGSLKSPGKQKSFEEGILSSPEDSNPQVLTMKSALKQWVHPPDKLLTGHIVYNVKVRRSRLFTYIVTARVKLFLMRYMYVMLDLIHFSFVFIFCDMDMINENSKQFLPFHSKSMI